MHIIISQTQSHYYLFNVDLRFVNEPGKCWETQFLYKRMTKALHFIHIIYLQINQCLGLNAKWLHSCLQLHLVWGRHVFIWPHWMHITLEYSFARRIVSEWNRLPEVAVMCEDINHFKGHLDKFLRHRVGDYTSQKTAPFPVYSSPTSP